MDVLVNATLWVWDFVVGDVILAVGVALALIAALVMAGSHSAMLVNTWAQVIFIVIILATLGFSLWRGAAVGKGSA